MDIDELKNLQEALKASQTVNEQLTTQLATVNKAYEDSIQQFWLLVWSMQGKVNVNIKRDVFEVFNMADCEILQRPYSTGVQYQAVTKNPQLLGLNDRKVIDWSSAPKECTHIHKSGLFYCVNAEGNCASYVAGDWVLSEFTYDQLMVKSNLTPRPIQIGEDWYEFT